MTKEETFVNELIGYIFAYPDDDYMTMECLCRKLYKYGLIDKKDGEWTCNFIEKADTLQTDLVEDSDDLVKDLVKDTPQIDYKDGKEYLRGYKQGIEDEINKHHVGR